MFERKKYKKFARTQLSGRWAVPVLITILVTIISELFSIPEYIAVYKSDLLSNYSTMSFSEIILQYKDITSNATSTLTMIIQLLVSIVLEIAVISVFLKMSRSPEPISFSTFFEGLNNWARAILAYLWYFLWIFIWAFVGIGLIIVLYTQESSLNYLFMFLILVATCVVIIIKSYAYSQMFYIIAEYRDVSIPKAMKISIEITKDHKADLFVLGLSFIGWAFLSIFTLFIANFWLVPYMNMTYVNAYHALMKEAIEAGRIKPEDLSK